MRAAQALGFMLNFTDQSALEHIAAAVNERFGAIGFNRTRSRKLGPKGTRVNAVATGFVEKTILATISDKVRQLRRGPVPLHRLGRPEDLASVYAFLASDEATTSTVQRSMCRAA